MSVVIPSVAGGALLRECLAALEPQAEGSRLEILVVPREAGLTIPRMRAKGIVETAAPIVAILGEHVRPGPGWAAAMLRGHAEDPLAAAVGGPIGAFNQAGPVARAAFLAEYSAQMGPVVEPRSFRPAGINVSYKRSAIEACGDLFFRGEWETTVHDGLERQGFHFLYAEGAGAVVTRTYRFLPYLTEKWRIARSYAGMNAARIGVGGRLARAAATVFLPALVTSRILRRVVQRRGVGGALSLLPVLPFLLADVAAWTLGEFVGYLFGQGSSTERVV